MSASQLSFCPDCQTLLQTERDTTVVHKCPNCTYETEIKGLHLIHNIKFKETGSVVSHIPTSTVHDAAVKRTTRVQCKNAECPSLDIQQWGNISLTHGFKIEPNTMIINYNDPNRISTYICRICDHIFRP